MWLRRCMVRIVVVQDKAFSARGDEKIQCADENFGGLGKVLDARSMFVVCCCCEKRRFKKNN
jgi:hypothetical protein